MINNKVILKNNIRISVSDTLEIAKQIIEAHEMLPLASVAISTFATVIHSYSKVTQSPNLLALVNGNGPLGSLGIGLDNIQNTMRGFVAHPDVPTDYDDIDVNSIPITVGIGDSGTMQVSGFVNGESRTSNTQLAKFDITTDWAYYMDQSDQIYSAVISDVHFKERELVRAKSAIFQLLPNHTEEDIKWIESFITENKLSDYTFDQYIEKIDGKLASEDEFIYKCSCSRETVSELVEQMSEEEKAKIIMEHGSIDVVCNFCNKKRSFGLSN